jgi:hypothetical protein
VRVGKGGRGGKEGKREGRVEGSGREEERRRQEEGGTAILIHLRSTWALLPSS